MPVSFYMVNIMTTQSKHNFSLEFFPPKTAEGTEKLRATRQQLATLKPEFFSVTFGAGGTTQDSAMPTSWLNLSARNTATGFTSK